MISNTIIYYLNYLVNGLLWLTEETFWVQLFGEQLFQLVNKYISNEFVFLSLIYYINSNQHILGFFSHIKIKCLTYWYCTIKISEKEENGYKSIESFIASQLSNRRLRYAEAKVKETIIVGAEYDYIPDSHKMTPKLELFPADKKQEFTYDGHKFWVEIGSDSDENQRGNGNQLSEMLNMLNQSNTMSITMRTRDVNVLKAYMEEWIQIQFEKKYGKMLIYKSCASGYNQGWVQLCAKDLRPLDSVLLKQGQKEALFKDIRLFRHRKEWYNKLGVPYRRGILLYGPPGTGKTSCVQAIASQLKMNVAILSITSKMDDESVQYHLRTLPYNTILLIEDIDHCQGFKITSGKKKSKKQTHDDVNEDNNDNEDIGNGGSGGSSEGTVTMTGILNALDGVVAQEGSIVFMTCNDPTDIEPALLRPGRIDLKLELSYADKSQLKAMYIRFMASYETVPSLHHNKMVDYEQQQQQQQLDKKEKDHFKEIEKPLVELNTSSSTTPTLTPSSSTELISLPKSSSSSSSLMNEDDPKDDSIPPSSTYKTLEEDAEQFSNIIPSNHVTPAELQNFFITYLDLIQESEQPLDQIIQLIPTFLDSVKHDREHAKKVKAES
ncbi:unnamed protein product [Cunninghamella blakesleeana]